MLFFVSIIPPVQIFPSHIATHRIPSPSHSQSTTIASRCIALEECTLRTSQLSFDTSAINRRETPVDDPSPTTTRQAVHGEFWRFLRGTGILDEGFEAQRCGERRAIVLGDQGAFGIDDAADGGLGAFDDVVADYFGSRDGGAFVEGDGEC